MAGGKEHRTGLRHSVVTRQPQPADIGSTVMQTATTGSRIAARLTTIGEIGIAAGFNCNSVPVTSQALVDGSPDRSNRNFSGAVTIICEFCFRLRC